MLKKISLIVLSGIIIFVVVLVLLNQNRSPIIIYNEKGDLSENLDGKDKKNNNKKDIVLEKVGASDKRKNNNQRNMIKKEGLKILFFGDLMLDRYNRTLMNKNGAEYFTQKIKELFAEPDLVVVNLEGPVTNNESVSSGKGKDDPNHFRFTFDQEQTKQFLNLNRIKIVNIGNNHILNFNNDGLEQTKEFLEKNSIDYFGDPFDPEKTFLIKKIKGQKIALVNYSRFSGPKVMEVEKIIQKLDKEVDLVIVYAHWGLEYKLVNSKAQKNKAHRFIEAGADLIIGSHPHVVQPIEVYKDKVIFYSLGNFVFDQYFSEEVRSVLGVEIDIKKNKDKEKGIDLKLIPLEMQKTGQLEFMSDKKKRDFLQFLREESILSDELKREIFASK